MYRGIVARRITLPYQALQDSRDQLRNRTTHFVGIVNSLKLAVISVDAAQNVVVFYPQAEVRFRISAREVLGTPFDRVIPAGVREAHCRHLAGYDGIGERGGRAVRGDRTLTGLRADGEAFPIDALISHTAVAGRLLYTVVLRDVTERVRAQGELQRYVDMVAHSDDAVLSCDPDGTIRVWNPAAKRLFGYSRDEMVAGNVHVLFSANMPPAGRGWFEQAIRGQRFVNYETVRRRKDGSDGNVAITTSVLRDSDGQVVGSTAIFRDVTARKRMEAELHRAAARVTQSRGRSARIARPPARTISGAANRARSGKNPHCT